MIKVLCLRVWWWWVSPLILSQDPRLLNKSAWLQDSGNLSKAATIPEDLTRYRFQTGRGEVLEGVWIAFLNYSAFLCFWIFEFISKLKLISWIHGPGMYLNSIHYRAKIFFFYTTDNYLWNSLPQEVTQARTIREFKMGLANSQNKYSLWFSIDY